MDATEQLYNVANVTARLSASNPGLCESCSADMGQCTSLHPYYLAGGVSTIIGSLIVIISYILTPKLRYHPSILIFYRAIFDLGLGISFTILPYLNIQNLICYSIPCDIMGMINLFLFLCSIGSYIALSYDLYQSIKNPFSLPKTQNVKMTNTIIIVSSLLLSTIARWRWKFAYRSKLQYCSFREFNTVKQSFNPYSIIFWYTPIIVASIIAISVTIYSAKRLIKGLPHTFQSRKSAIRNAWWYSIVITFYTTGVGLFYFISWGDFDENPAWDRLYAVFLPSFGVADLVVWIITNFDKCNCNSSEFDRDRGKSHYQGHVKQLKLEHPQDIFNEIRNDIKQDSCGKRCCTRIGITVVNDKDNVMINEALRREILAYTTDGISQSVENCEKSSSLMDSHYPQNTKDLRNNVISSFSLKIEKNFGLVGKQETDRYKKSRVFCKCCCIKSTQHNDMLAVPLRPISSINIRAVEIDSDFDRSEERQFVDYAPQVFRHIRRKIMKIKDDDYQESITPRDSRKQESVLRKSKIGDGKSGAFFFVSHDSKYVVKTLSKSEVKFLISILKDYVEYLKKNPHTILSRYVGLHSLKIYGLVKYFVVMENVFQGGLRPREIYDLKGSWVNRATNPDGFGSSTMKDCDLKRPIVMDKQNRDNIIMQLNRDTLFLQQQHIMDYSILLGIYYLKIEFQSMKPLTGINEEKREEKNEYSYPQRGSLTGIRARINECPGIYFIGIIDTLQEYSIKKKMETWLKVYVKRTNSNGLSSVDPELYQKRFMNYMNYVIISEHDYKSKLNIPKQPLMVEKVLIYASSTKDTDKNYSNRNHEIQIARSEKIKTKNKKINIINANRLTTPIRPRTFSSNQLVVENRFAHSPASFHHNMLDDNEEKLEEDEDVLDHDILDVVDDQQEIAISDIQTNVSANDSVHDSIRDTESAF